jgi:2-dehydro-3-deoxyglucarate aldolase/4-hydroxy-2-oxoheptanedioate aldolase
MNDRLNELLKKHDVLYSVLCRDITATDVELYAQAGYHIVWLDLEHSAQSTTEALSLGRLITHLGMVPLVRVLELSRTHVQRLLDGGMQIITLPDVRNAKQAQRLVQLGKYPPVGERGVSSNTAGVDFDLGPNPAATLQNANEATHLMALFESDEGYANREEIVAVEGIDVFGVGPSDWATSLNLFGKDAEEHLTPRIENIMKTIRQAGKICIMGASTAEQASYYRDLGAQILGVGGDITIKRQAYFSALTNIRS